MKLSERIKFKRANYSAKFSVEALHKEQIEELLKAIKDLSDEEANPVREAFIAEHCGLKLVVTRLSEEEERAAREDGLKAVDYERVKYGVEAVDSSGRDIKFSSADMLTFNRAQRKSYWQKLRRHIDSAEERQEDGEWRTLEQPVLNQWLDLIAEHGIDEVGFIIGRYSKLKDDDKAKAEGDPSFLEKAS